MKDGAVVLYNIRSIHNVGSIFRTAECAGIKKIYTAGYTPSPLDRFGRKRSDFAKVSLGAEDSLAWEHEPDPTALLRTLKDSGYAIISIEQDASSIDYKDVSVPEKAVFVYGNETEGISREILDLSDIIAEIPMAGKKESLNVSVTAGITLFRFLGR